MQTFWVCLVYACNNPIFKNRGGFSWASVITELISSEVSVSFVWKKTLNYQINIIL